MRSIKSFYFLLLISVFIFQSCSIEKRHYTNGYSLQWKKNSVAAKSLDKEEEIAVETKKENKNISTSIKQTFSSENNRLTASSEKNKTIILFSPDSTACDTLIMRNETEIKVKVLEVTPTEIKYKYCDNLNGPTYVSYRYEVSYIKYPNGTLDSFVNEHAPIKPVKNKQFVVTDDNRTERYVRKKSVTSMIFGFMALIPIYGAPASVIAMILGAKCLRLINKNPKELWPYRQKATIGLVIGAIVFIIYLALIIYALIKSGIFGI